MYTKIRKSLNWFLISLLVVIGFFSINVIVTSFAEERIVIILPNAGDPICKNDDTCLSPSTIYINPGDNIVLEDHSVGAKYFVMGSPQSGPKDQFFGKFDESGVYYFYDMTHPWLVGKIVVGIKNAPQQNYDESKAKLEKIQQEMKQQQEANDLLTAKTYIVELTGKIQDLFDVISNLEFQIEQLKIDNGNLKNQQKHSTNDESKVIASFVDPKKDPQSYIDRYNTEPEYKIWFDSNYPDYSIYEAVGKHEPVPEWIKNNARWWAEGKITEDEFVKGIEYLVTKGTIKVN